MAQEHEVVLAVSMKVQAESPEEAKTMAMAWLTEVLQAQSVMPWMASRIQMVDVLEVVKNALMRSQAAPPEGPAEDGTR